MPYNFEDDVKLFMVFDILGDTERTGPKLWYIDRKRLEDIKNHILDVILIYRILERYMPAKVNSKKAIDYIIFHDLPEAITGDITKFQGVSSEERKRVTKIAIDYLDALFSHIVDIKGLIEGFENTIDIEAKIANMIDKVHSATTFIKYQSEKNIDVNDPRILPGLRNHPFVVQKLAEGKDLADVFFEFHLQSVNINDEECEKYGISLEERKRIIEAIKGFIQEMMAQKRKQTLLNVANDFPKEAMTYR